MAGILPLGRHASTSPIISVINTSEQLDGPIFAKYQRQALGCGGIY